MKIPRIVYRSVALGLTLAVIGLAGCSSESKVEGEVKYKGQPVEGATVQFIDSQGNSAGSGFTDASGKFTIKTPQAKDRIPSGTYKVVVTKTPAVSGSAGVMDPESMRAAKEGAKAGGPSKDYLKDMMGGARKAAAKSEIPQQFASDKTTTLSVTVPSSSPIVLDLGS